MGWLIMALILLSGCTNTPKQEAMYATTPHKNQRLPRNLPKKMFGIALQLPADFNSYTQAGKTTQPQAFGLKGYGKCRTMLWAVVSFAVL